MKARLAYIVAVLLISGCVSTGPGLYRHDSGNWLTLKSNNHFHYEDVIPLGHWDQYVYADGIYTEKNDTLYFTYTWSNSDSIYHNGRKISYTLPGYVVRKGKGFMIQSQYGDMRFIKKP